MVTDTSLHPQKPAARTRRWMVNLTPAERAARVLIGSSGVVVAVVLLLSAGSLWSTVGALLLAAAGFDLLITGALGHCPLYAKLGHVPNSLERNRPHDS